MSAREEILARIRAKLGPGPEQEPALSTPGPASRGTRTAEPAALFVARLEAAGGRVTRVRDEEQAGRELVRILAEHGARSLAVSDDPLALRLARASGAELVPADAERSSLLGADCGLCRAQHGVVETGSLLLCSESERHRLVSLLPPVHVALLRESDLLTSLGEAFALTAEATALGLPRALTFITGPSRTADIELRLVVGVHGPRALHLILLEERPAQPEKS